VHSHHTTDGQIRPEPAVTPIAAQPAPHDQRWAWARYLCLPHVRYDWGQVVAEGQG
jgi:hypothetical protein